MNTLINQVIMNTMEYLDRYPTKFKKQTEFLKGSHAHETVSCSTFKNLCIQKRPAVAILSLATH